MKVMEVVSGASFDTAIELGNSTVRPQSKSVGHKSAGNGVRRKTNRVNLPGKMATDLAAADRAITEANRMMLWIDANGRKHFTKMSQFAAVRAAQG